MKRGDIRVLGAASYATPLLSTAFLILAGYAKPGKLSLAVVLIAGGGLMAAKDMFGSQVRGSSAGCAPASLEMDAQRHCAGAILPGSKERWTSG